MSFCFHKTLLNSKNINNVIKGTFFPIRQDSPQIHNQYLCTLGSSVEIMRLEVQEKRVDFISIYTQNLFSKIFYACIGPKYDEVLDTFFIIRETDIILFKFSKNKKFFVEKGYAELPKLCLTPNYGYFKDFSTDETTNDSGKLIISCFHGGICLFNVERGNEEKKFTLSLVREMKPCNIVLTQSPCFDNDFFRIEAGQTIAYYSLLDCSLQKKETCPGEQICDAFKFGNDGIILCFKQKIQHISKNAKSDIIPLGFKEINIENSKEFFSLYTHISDSEVIIVSTKNYFYRLKSDLSMETINFRSKVQSFPALRLFSLSTEFFLVISKFNPAILYLSTDAILMQISLKSLIGLQNIIVYNPPLTKKEFEYVDSPQIISYSENFLYFIRQGMNMDLMKSFELPSSPNNVFELSYEGKTLLIFSFESTSKLFEITLTRHKIEIAPSSIPFNESVRTIGVGKFNNKIFIISPEKVDTFPFDITKQKVNPENEFKLFLANSSQSVYVTENKINIVLNNSDSYEKEIDFIPTCINFTPPVNDDKSDYLVIGAKEKDQNKYRIIFQRISKDAAESHNEIEEEVPNEIVSIEFFPQINEKPLGALVGLITGGLIAYEVDLENRQLITKQVLQLGSSPCKIYHQINNNNNIFFGLSSRFWQLIPIGKSNIFKLVPFFVNSASIKGLVRYPIFFFVEGRMLNVYRFHNNRNHFFHSIATNMFRSNIIAIHQLYNFPLIIVIAKNAIYLFNHGSFQILALGNAKKYVRSKIIRFQNQERIMHSCISYTNQQVRNSYLGISGYMEVGKGARRYFIRVYEVNDQALEKFMLGKPHQNSALQTSIAAPNIPTSQQATSGQQMGNYQKMPINPSILGHPKMPVSSDDNNQFLIPQIKEKKEDSDGQFVDHPVNALAITFSDYYNNKPLVNVIIGESNRVWLYIIKNERLYLLSTIKDIGLSIKGISVYPDRDIRRPIIFFAADSHYCYTILRIDRNTNQIQKVSKETTLRPITNSTIVDKYSSSHPTTKPHPSAAEKPSFSHYLCGGDQLGNCFIFDVYANDNRSPQIRLNANINVGDVVTGTAFGDGAYAYNSFDHILYSTIGGNIGCIVINPLKNQRLSFNEICFLENEISAFILASTHCDTVAFRNKYYVGPTKIIDLDVLEMFLKLPKQNQEEITKKVNDEIKRKAKRDDDKIENKQKSNDDFSVEALEVEILRMSNYFWLWNIPE